MVHAEHTARAPHARLYLIHDQQQIMPVAQSPELGEIAGSLNDDAALALNGFHDHGARLVGNGGFYRRRIVEGNMRESRHEWRKGSAVFLPARCGQRAHRLAMIRAFCADEIGLARRDARHFQRRFHRLRAAVGVKRIFQITGSDFGQFLGQFHLRFAEKRARGQGHSVQLPFYRMDNTRMPMPAREHAETAHEVQILRSRQHGDDTALRRVLHVPEAAELQQTRQTGIDVLLVLLDHAVNTRLRVLAAKTYQFLLQNRHNGNSPIQS